MKIIRWLLSHTFLILLIVVVIYGYMFWGNLAGKNTPVGKAVAYLSAEFEEVGEFVAAIEAKQEKLSQKKSLEAESLAVNDNAVLEESEESVKAEPINIDSTNQVVKVESVETDKSLISEGDNSRTDFVEVNNSSVSRDITQQQVSISYSQNHMRVKQNETGIIEKISKPAVATAGVENNAVVSTVPPVINSVADDTFVSTEIETQLNSVDSHGKLKKATPAGDVIRASWITARKSFYQRNYALSEKSYQNVIAYTKDNYDAYGELGNVYFNQGKKKQAATAYFEAAVILLRKGQLNRVRSLIGLLYSLDKSKANELKKIIDSSLS